MRVRVKVLIIYVSSKGLRRTKTIEGIMFMRALRIRRCKGLMDYANTYGQRG